jgi:hypothetical protein
MVKKHDSFKKYEVWRAIPKEEVPKDSETLISIWAMGSKSNGVKRVRLNSRGFE